MKTFRDLIIWQKPMTLVTKVYKISNTFPNNEAYGLTSQIRRCSISIPSNIAKGYGRNYTNDYIHFLRIATGSLYELQTQHYCRFYSNKYSKDIYKNISGLYGRCSSSQQNIYLLMAKNDGSRYIQCL